MGAGEHVIEADLLDFIRDSIQSMWHVELLLLLRRHPGRVWTAGELNRELRASDLIVTEGLQALQAAGFVCVETGGTYRYAPLSGDLDRLVGDLDTLYRAKPSLLRRAVLSRPDNKVQTFADAFRLKKD